MIHSLPSISNDRGGFEAVALLAKAASELRFGSLEVDFRRCTFFAANMAAVLGAILGRIELAFNSVEIVNLPDHVAKILCKNGFLENYGYAPLPDHNDTTLPFRRIQLDDKTKFDGYVRRHVRGKGMPIMTEALGAVFKRKLYEVFENAALHSGSDLGVCVCGQFFPNKQHLDITIADAGVGIRQNVRRFLRKSDLSSVEALKWALQEGHSTKTGPHPGGLGLQFLKDFISKNRGKIMIASRFGLYQFSKGKETFEKLSADLPGTAVTITINTGDTAAYCLSSELSVDDIF